jgi:hypothetical protein
MRRKTSFFFPIALLLFFLAGSSIAIAVAGAAPAQGAHPNAVDTSSARSRGRCEAEMGWIETNGQQYLQLTAENHYELGALEGQYLADKILYGHGLIQQLVQQYQLDINELMYLAQLYENFIPERYKQEMQGISSVLPITYNDILLQNAWLDIYYGHLIPQMTGAGVPPIEIAGCTAIGTNNFVLDAVGQNMDFAAPFEPSTYWIRYKVGDSPRVFCLGVGSGKISIGKNPYVIAAATVIKTAVTGEIGIPQCVKSRMAFETAENADEFVSIMESSFTSSWNYIVADTIFSEAFSKPIACETLPATAVNIPVEDITVRTNTYVTDSLRPYLLSQTYSMARQAKAEYLAEEDRGRLTIKEIGEILSYHDGTDASITRYAQTPEDTKTLAFFISNGIISYFGLGNPRDADWGKIIL